MKIINKYNNRGITITTIKRSGSSYLKFLCRMIVNKTGADFKETMHKIPENLDLFNNYYNENLKNEQKNDFSTYQDYVCKTFAPHFKKFGVRTIPGTYNIFLIRKGIFEGTLSQAYSDITGIYGTDERKLYQINISLDKFKKELKTRINETNSLLKNETKLKYDAIVTYEDLTLDYDTDIGKLGFKKMRNLNNSGTKFPDKRETIENYDELKEYFDNIKHTIKINNATVENGIITDFTVQHQENK